MPSSRLSSDQIGCLAAAHGPWAIHFDWLERAIQTVLAAVRSGAPLPQFGGANLAAVVAGQTAVRDAGYLVDSDGVAVISISGVMQKGVSKFGGANTLALRRQLRQAARDTDVRGIMMVVDSPGGTIAGTDELARDVAKARESKPVRAHVDDLGGSAAYWVASQAERVTASATSMVGSIGTFSIIHDTSGAAEIEGIKVHLVTTGEFKGRDNWGVPVPDEYVQHVQKLVSSMNEHMLAAVGQGRQMDRRDVARVATGEVWLASEAKARGLIDKVQSFDEAMDAFRSAVKPRQRSSQAAASSSRLSLAAEMEASGYYGVDSRTSGTTLIRR